jgi:hypothetical protein
MSLKKICQKCKKYQFYLILDPMWYDFLGILNQKSKTRHITRHILTI